MLHVRVNPREVPYSSAAFPGSKFYFLEFFGKQHCFLGTVGRACEIVVASIFRSIKLTETTKSNLVIREISTGIERKLAITLKSYRRSSIIEES